jgi:hypothetical protein
MKSQLLAVLLIAGGVGVPAVFAQQPNAALQALDDALPGTLINNPTKMNWPVFGSGASSRQVRAPGVPGDYALQVQSPSAASTLYAIGFNAPLTSEVKVGQHITVAFWARAVRAATPDQQGVLGIRLQRNSAPYPGFGDTRLAIVKEWKLYEVKFVADQAITADLAVVGFQLSGARQTIEVGQTYVLDMDRR